MKKTILIISILILLLSVDAQIPEDVVSEDFDDDDAIPYGGDLGPGWGKNNVITGENPDEDWYFFVPITSGCGVSGQRSAMFVSEPGSLTVSASFTHTWSTNILVATSNDGVFGGGCFNPTYQLVNDVEGQTEIIEFDLFIHEESTGNMRHSWGVYGEGLLIGRYCAEGSTWIVTNNPSTCSTSSGGLSFGSVGGHDVQKIRMELDWENQDFTVTILESRRNGEVGVPAIDTPKTVSFGNNVASHEYFQVTSSASSSERYQRNHLDNFIMKGPQFSETEEVVEPAEFESGIVAFANDWGFATPASQKLFVIIFVSVAMIVTAAITQFFNDSKLKNWIILGIGVGVSGFFVFSGFVEIWEITISTVLGGASVHGIRETINTLTSRRNTDTEVPDITERITVIEVPEPVEEGVDESD